MKLFDPEYKDFMNAAHYFANKLGVGEIAFKYGCSDKYLYQILSNKKPAGRNTQLKFAAACDFETVREFIDEHKRQTVIQEKISDHKKATNHWYFYFALIKIIRDEWGGNIDQLIKETGVSKLIIKKTLNKKIITSEQTQAGIAERLYRTRKDLLEMGKKVEENFQKQMFSDEQPKAETKDPIVLEHEKMVGGFLDKETAKEFNHMLLNLERMDNDAYIDLYGETIKAYKKAKNRRDMEAPKADGTLGE